MSIREQINSDLIQAMKNKEATLVTMIRGVMAAFKEAEQKKREDLVKAAIMKHGVARPASQDDTGALAAYDQAVTSALAAEKVTENAALNDGEVLAVIQKLIKMRQDSIADADKAGRKDIAEAEQKEMAWLQAYLPRQMSRDEIEAEAKAVMAQVGASGPKDMGKVMGPLTGKLRGKADGKLISDVVRSLLGS